MASRARGRQSCRALLAVNHSGLMASLIATRNTNTALDCSLYIHGTRGRGPCPCAVARGRGRQTSNSKCDIPEPLGGIVSESVPGFGSKRAKVHPNQRKHFRATFGPKAAKAPLLQGCPKAAKASDTASRRSRPCMHPLAVIFTPIRATLYPSRQPTPPLPLWWGPENHLEASACRTSLARPRRRASHGCRGGEVCESARKRASENFGLSARK